MLWLAPHVDNGYSPAPRLFFGVILFMALLCRKYPVYKIRLVAKVAKTWEFFYTRLSVVG